MKENKMRKAGEKWRNTVDGKEEKERKDNMGKTHACWGPSVFSICIKLSALIHL